MKHEQYMSSIKCLREERDKWSEIMIEISSRSVAEKRPMTEEEFREFEQAHDMANGISDQIQKLFEWHIDELRKVA